MTVQNELSIAGTRSAIQNEYVKRLRRQRYLSYKCSGTSAAIAGRKIESCGAEFLVLMDDRFYAYGKRKEEVDHCPYCNGFVRLTGVTVPDAVQVFFLNGVPINEGEPRGWESALSIGESK